MQSGRLRERVTIQYESKTRDTSGEELINWLDEATVWAQVLPGSSSERFQAAAGQRVAEVTHTVRIRYRPGLTPKKRFLWEGRILKIQGITDPEGRTRVLVIPCSEEQRG